MDVTPKRLVSKRQRLEGTSSLHIHGSELGRHQRSYKMHHRKFLRNICTCLPDYIPKHGSHAVVVRYLVISYAVFHIAPISETPEFFPYNMLIFYLKHKSEFFKIFFIYLLPAI